MRGFGCALCFQQIFEMRYWAWFPPSPLACRRQNFLHGTCAKWSNEYRRTKNYLLLCSNFKFRYFNLCDVFSQRSQSDSFLSHLDVSRRSKKNFTKWPTYGFSGPKRWYIVKTRIIELSLVFTCDGFPWYSRELECYIGWFPSLTCKDYFFKDFVKTGKTTSLKFCTILKLVTLHPVTVLYSYLWTS